MIIEATIPTLRRALADAFTVEEEIGRGGMGIVFRARDKRYDRVVAIKVLRPELVTSMGGARFSREIAIEARLQHPNVVPIHEWGERDGLTYCVMPFIEGESLRARLERERQLSVGDALRIATEVASALTYAHAQGIVHRDVKPENILLSSGHAMLTDFGIAYLANEPERLTSSGLIVGTVRYMSPERADPGAPLDPRTDTYALGCVLFEMLAGDPPFNATSAQAVMARHQHEPPPPLAIIRPSVPPHVVAAIERALAKIPADRFETTDAFAAALAAPDVSAGFGLTRTGDPALTNGARKPRPAPRAARWWVAGGVAVAAVAAATWLASSWPTPVLDDSKVVVFPLVSASDSAPGSTEGWDAAIAIGASLEHAQPLRVIDGWSYLSPASRANPRLLTASIASRVSRERRARYYIDGVITRRGNDSAAIVLRLNDVRGDSVVAQETAVASGTEPLPTTGIRAATRLLPRLLDPARRIDLSAMASRQPSAIALWLQGERAYRQSRFEPALELFRRALGEDSALVLAAVRGAQAASWELRLDEAESLARFAVKHRGLLSPRQARLALGFWHYLHGNADSAVTELSALVRDDPDGVEAPMALAEVYHHLLVGPGSPPDSAAERWLRAAAQRDSTFTPPLMHLAEIEARRGEPARVDELLAKLAARGSEPAFLRTAELMRACVRSGTARWDAVARVEPKTVLSAAKELSAHLAQPRCAEQGFTAILRAPDVDAGVRWSALLGLQGILVATRRDVELRALLDSTVRAGTSQARALYIIDAMGGADRSLMKPKADEAAAFAQRAYGATYERASPQTRWVLGLWHASEGDTARLAAMSATSDSVALHGSRRERLIADAMRGHLALAKGDTARAIAILQTLAPSARRDSLTYELFEPLAVERATLALLLLATHDPRGALRVAAQFDHGQPAIYLPFIPLSLDIRRRAASELDRSAEAAQYTARLRVLSASNPDR